MVIIFYILSLILPPAVVAPPGKIKYVEQERIDYIGAKFAAGRIYNNKETPQDVLYLEFSKKGQRPWIFDLTIDEAEAIIYVLSGALWSNEIERTK